MKKITTTKELFVAKDGTQFETEEACRIYELENQEEYIESEIVMHGDKWGAYEQLTGQGYVFDTNNESLMGMLKYVLSEVILKIRLNTSTGEYEILLVDGKNLQ